MSQIILGRDAVTGNEVGFDSDHLARHLHLVGSTGSGKTTALLTIVRQLLTTAYEPACLFVIDPMGNLSQDLLRWMANTLALHAASAPVLGLGNEVPMSHSRWPNRDRHRR